MKIIKKYFPFFFIFLAVLAIYFPVFSLYFTQDDFFVLKMGTAKSVSDFLNFFSFHNSYNYAFYRPFTTQVYAFVMKSLFNLQPLSFHLVSFIFFLANIFLVFKILEKLLKKKSLSFLVAFFYGINASNLGSLAYISNFQEIGMAFFLFLSFWLYLEDKKIAPLFFVFSLLSKENALVFPLILIVYEFLLGQRGWRKTLPFWLVLIVYGLLRLGAGLPDVSVYQPVFTPIKIFNSYFWYLLWGIGLPEMLIDFVGPGLKIDPRLIIYYRQEIQIIFSASLVFALLLAGSILRSSKKDKSQEVFFLLWFMVGLLPVIFWPWHKFAYYLTFPLLGLVGFLVLLLKNLPKVLIGVGIFLLLVVSLTTIHLSWRTYWVITRAKIAENLVNDLKAKYPQLPQGATLYFENDPEYPLILGFGNSSTQAYYTLSGENGPQVIYNDLSLKVYYQDFGKPSEGENLFTLVAKIRQK
jgi:hypothetical protein